MHCRPCSELPRFLHTDVKPSDVLRQKPCGSSSRKPHRVFLQAAIVESETSPPAQAARIRENRIPASNILIQSPSQIRLAGQDVEDAALKACVQHHLQHPQGLQIQNFHDSSALTEAYKKCGAITKMYAKTFYLGTQLMTPEKARAIWAIYVWCRRTDELVDGPNASRITPMVGALQDRRTVLQCLDEIMVDVMRYSEAEAAWKRMARVIALASLWCPNSRQMVCWRVKGGFQDSSAHSSYDISVGLSC